MNQMGEPYHIFLDPTGNIFVSDFQFDQVVKWSPGASTGELVAGGNGRGSALNQLSHPQGVVSVSAIGSILVADENNHRVVKWNPGAPTGEVVAGRNGPGAALNQLNKPVGLSVDADGNFFVCERLNHRVVRFGGKFRPPPHPKQNVVYSGEDIGLVT